MSLSLYLSLVLGLPHTFLTCVKYKTNRRWQTSRASLVVCEELVLRDHAFFIGHEEALLEHQQDLLWCSKLSKFLYYLRGVEGSYVTFYHLKEKRKRYDWDTQCIEVKIKEHRHTIWNATRDMTARAASTLTLKIFGTKGIYIRMDKPKCLIMYFP